MSPMKDSITSACLCQVNRENPKQLFHNPEDACNLLSIRADQERPDASAASLRALASAASLRALASAWEYTQPQ